MNRYSGTLRAKWIVPVDSDPIRNGIVTVDDGLIVSIAEDVRSQPNEIDLGDAAILPGLINAHTHLEFSNLYQPLGHAGIPFTDWIWLVVQHRIGRTIHTDAADTKALAIQQGITESRQAGVVHVGEIATGPFSNFSYSKDVMPQVTAFIEILGRDDRQLEEKLAHAKTGVDALQHATLLAGLSPHASYSVSPKMLDDVIEMASTERLPIAMHLAESKAELELLEKIDGPFVPLLQRLGAWFPESYCKNTRPLHFLQKLSRLSRVLIVHGNYLSQDELEFMSYHKSIFSVAYCPRTHQFFGHDPYPLKQMLELEINVALGTDSRASNPDLNLLNEMKAVRVEFPDISPKKIVEMATIGGARALGLQQKLGSLKPGKRAIFSVASITETSMDEPYAAILNANEIKIYDFSR